MKTSDSTGDGRVRILLFGAGCCGVLFFVFLFSHGFGVRNRRTVVTFGVVSFQNVELSSLLGF